MNQKMTNNPSGLGVQAVYNFGAGPAVLPREVLKKAARELTDYHGSGMSVMELSHRGKYFQQIISDAETILRRIMAIPDSYKVLFLQGGASLQFAMVPINLMTCSGKADYIHTGQWSKKAIKEARRLGKIKIVASSEKDGYCKIPAIDPAQFRADADYVFLVTNNTIYGTRFRDMPDTGNVPIVADMSSNILSEPIDVTQYGLIFAGAQKNIGPAGLTIVIIREDLVGKAGEAVPAMLNYQTFVEARSLFNTPPCFAIYMAKLVFEWIESLGGLTAIRDKNQHKADLLYGALDQSALFQSTVKGQDRSMMNVPFMTGMGDLDDQFIKEAEAQGLLALKGHRAVGGMRASIYNAMPIEGVQALVKFMKEFEQTHAKG